MCSDDCLLAHPWVRAQGGAAAPAGARSRARRARSGGGGGAARRAGHGRRNDRRGQAGNAPRRGARDVPVACARRAGPGLGRAGVGGSAPPARGCGLRGRPGRARRGRLRDARGREALRRRAARARACARGRWRDVGPAHRRRWTPLTALAAASVARPGQILLVGDKEESSFLEPLPLSLLPLSTERYAELEGLGLRRLGELAQLPGAAVSERLGTDGRQAWRLARGGRKARVRGRRPPAELVEVLTFPEAVGNELTLRRALGSLLERLLARPERAGRPFRKLAVAARHVDGGSWRRTLTLRDATAELGRLRTALGPKLCELSAPIVELRVEAVELAEHTGQQLALVETGGEDAAGRLREGLRQVRASTGTGSVCAVVEVAPWSRIPEARALVVPRDA